MENKLQHHQRHPMAQHLNLSDFNITSIKPTTLIKSYKELVSLVMDYNYGFDLPLNEEFLKNSALQSFDCNYCGISQISAVSFRDLPNLHQLSLTHNRLEFIDENAFKENLKLSLLNLEFNFFTKLNAKNHLNSLPHLTVFNLNNNQQFKFYNNISIIESTKLTTFTCHQCAIDSIPNKVFSKLPQMKRIDLSANQITVINLETFVDNIFLEHVNLSDNRGLESIQLDNKYVRELLCNNCSLHEIDKNTFSNLSSLEVLQLKNNQIKKINAHAFDCQRATLRHIQLQGNLFNEFPNEIVSQCSALLELCFDLNSINDAELFVQNYTYLFDECDDKFEIKNPTVKNDVLRQFINANEIYDLISSSENFANLSNQNIFYLNPKIFDNFKTIDSVNLDSNPNITFYKNDPILIHTNLTDLSLKRCQLQVISKYDFAQLPNLNKLNLSLNRITKIVNEAFQSNLDLVDINLDYNRLETFSAIIVEHLFYLEKLTLNHNALLIIDPTQIFLWNERLITFEWQQSDAYELEENN